VAALALVLLAALALTVVSCQLLVVSCSKVFHRTTNN
jgi:hypothetical protein